jgi:hypothetical protein
MSDRDADRLADRLEREVDELQRRSGELQDRAKQVGEDWRRKRGDERIPGAPPEPEDEQSHEQDEAQQEHERTEAQEEAPGHEGE